MALTQGAWSVKSLNGHLVMTETVAWSAGLTDISTLPTPNNLDTSKPWTLVLTTLAAGQTLDGSTAPVDIWAGTADDFASGTAGTDVAATMTSGVKVVTAAHSDIKAGGTFVLEMVPGLAVADVANTKIRVPVAGNYIISVNGGSGLDSGCTSIQFMIIQ